MQAISAKPNSCEMKSAQAANPVSSLSPQFCGERVASAEKREPGEGRRLAPRQASVTRGPDRRVHPLRKNFFANRMDCRVKPGNDDCDCQHAYAEERVPGAAADCSARNGPMASMVASGNSSCTASLPWGSRAVRTPPTAASASISARDLGGVSAP